MKKELTEEEIVKRKEEKNESCLSEFVNIIRRHEADLEVAFKSISELNKLVWLLIDEKNKVKKEVN